METRATLRPGKRGTKRYVKLYGDRLVCVRYRYDVEANRRYTTVEVIVDESEWRGRQAAGEADVYVQIRYDEYEAQKRARRAGGRWDAERRLWRMGLVAAKSAGLADRIRRK